jgi:uncharacterized protein YjbI with pentapeptide repeats
MTEPATSVDPKNKSAAAQGGPELTWKTLTPAELASALASHERFVKGIPGGRRALLAHHSFEGMDFTGRTLTEIDLVGAKLAACLFRKTNMARANLFAADLRRANLDGADLTRSDLRGAAFRGASLNGAILADADIREAVLARVQRELIPVNHEGESAATDLSVIDAKGADLSSAKLGGSFVLRADFTNASLKGTNFRKADLRAANFTNANLEGAVLSGCKAAGANFQGAIMKGVQLWDVDFKGADFTGAILDKEIDSSILRNAILDGATIGSATMSGADLRGVQGLAA